VKKPVNPFKEQKKERSLNNLADHAWRLMSEYSRRRYADSNGYCHCVDGCGYYAHWKEFDAGHFVHAGSGGNQNPVSYDERNIHPQRPSCNRQPGSKHRHPGLVTQRFTEFMVGKYGLGITDQLETVKRQPWFRHAELEAQIELLKSRLSVIERSKKWQKEVA
jgi:hypothetical protein